MYVRYLEMFSLIGIVFRKYLFTDLYLHSSNGNPDHVTLLLLQQIFYYILLLYGVNIFYYLR